MQFSEEEIRKLFGNEAADDESADELRQYYLKGSAYEKLSQNIPFYMLVGHKGTGKSALFRILANENREQGLLPIEIRPDDFDIFRDNNSNINSQIKQLQDGLCNIVFRKIVDSLLNLNAIKHTDKNWVGWFARVSNLFKAVVKEKLADLKNKALPNIDQKQFLAIFKDTVFREKRVVIYIDDLDRGWKNTPGEIQFISALVNAVRALLRDVPGVCFRIAMRSSVYYSFRKSDESTDKFDSSVIWLTWTNNEIFVMLIKRISNFWGLNLDEKKLLKTPQIELNDKYLSYVFEKQFNSKDTWRDVPMCQVLMSLIRKRPRDLVKLCILSARKANKHGYDKINHSCIDKILSQYSNDRLLDAVNEYKTELEVLIDILPKMRPTTERVRKEKENVHVYSRQELLQKLYHIIEQTSSAKRKFVNGERLEPEKLMHFLYKINFLTARKDLENDEIRRYYFEEQNYLANEHVDYGFSFEIHPAYRWAIQPDNIEAIFNTLKGYNLKGLFQAS